MGAQQSRGSPISKVMLIEMHHLTSGNDHGGGAQRNVIELVRASAGSPPGSSEMTDQTDNLVLEQLRLIRKDLADQRSLLLQSVEHTSRMENRIEAKMVAFEQRLNHLRDDLELMSRPNSWVGSVISRR